MNILGSQVGSQDRLTGLKLVEASNGKGKFKTMCKELKSTSEKTVKSVILYLLENEYIR